MKLKQFYVVLNILLRLVNVETCKSKVYNAKSVQEEEDNSVNFVNLHLGTAKWMGLAVLAVIAALAAYYFCHTYSSVGQGGYVATRGRAGRGKILPRPLEGGTEVWAWAAWGSPGGPGGANKQITLTICRLENMESVLYHKECLVRLAMKGKLRVKDKETGVTTSLIPTIGEFELVKAGVKVLAHCRTTTKLFEVEKEPTMGKVVERLYEMQEELNKYKEEGIDEVAQEFAEELQEQLEKTRRLPQLGSTRQLPRFGNYLRK